MECIITGLNTKNAWKGKAIGSSMTKLANDISALKKHELTGKREIIKRIQKAFWNERKKIDLKNITIEEYIDFIIDFIKSYSEKCGVPK